MPRVAFAEFRPDAASFDSQYTADAVNVLPAHGGGYKPFPGPVRGVGRIQEQPRGTFEDIYNGANIRFVGTATKLYRWDAGTSAFVDESGSSAPYSLGDSNRWSFLRFGAFLLAFNGMDPPQKYDLDGSGPFVDLPGGLSPPPNGIVVDEHKDFVFTFFNLPDDTTAVQWSGIANPEIWDGTLLSDVQPIPVGGKGTALVCGENVLFFQRKTIHRFIYTAEPTLVFSREEIQTGRGCVGPQAAVKGGSRVFFLADDGFYSIGFGGDVTPIGAGRVNDYFFARCEPLDVGLTLAVADPELSLVYFAYKTGTVSVGVFNEILVYDWILDAWAVVTGFEFTDLFRSRTSSVTIEDLEVLYGNLEDVPGSLSDRQYQGGDTLIGIFTHNRFFETLSGAPLEARIETAPILEPAEVRKMVEKTFPVFRGLNVEVRTRVGTQEKVDDDPVWSAYKERNVTGWTTWRDAGRAIKFKVIIPEGEDWTLAQGINCNLKPLGAR